MQHPAPDPRQAVEPVPQRQRERPPRTDLDADLDARRGPTRRARQSPCLPITCTSTRNDRDAHDRQQVDRAASAALAVPHHLAGGPALDQRDRRGAGDEPGGGRGGRLDRRQRGRRLGARSSGPRRAPEARRRPPPRARRPYVRGLRRPSARRTARRPGSPGCLFVRERLSHARDMVTAPAVNFKGASRTPGRSGRSCRPCAPSPGSSTCWSRGSSRSRPSSGWFARAAS